MEWAIVGVVGLAWVDESFADDIYIFGAVVFQANEVDDARSAALDLKHPGETKAHWYSRVRKQRNVMVDVLTTLSPAKIVVARLPIVGESSERQRRKCLGLLLPALASTGVSVATFESRGPKDDQRDRDMLSALRRQHLIGSALKMGHARGTDEPLLWLADALCGAVMADRRGETMWWEPLRKTTEVITVDGREQ